MSTALVILAAGASVRMGQPKQLLLYNGESLLLRAVKAGLQAGCTPVIVVTGAHREQVCAAILGQPVRLVHNAGWEEGMASSIRCGMAALQEAAPDLHDVILMVCDQPFAGAGLLQALMQERKESGRRLVASLYGDKPGVPALFSADYLPQLLQLEGKEGAKKLIASQWQSLALVPFPLGVTDIDTPEDYDRLLGISGE